MRQEMEIRADNLTEVAEWCGGIACSSYVSYVPSSSEGAEKAWPGTYLVTDGREWWTEQR